MKEIYCSTIAWDSGQYSRCHDIFSKFYFRIPLELILNLIILLLKTFRSCYFVNIVDKFMLMKEWFFCNKIKICREMFPVFSRAET